MGDYSDVKIGVDWKEIDKGIREVIYILNKKGYRTAACCEGHWDKETKKYSTAYISFNLGFTPPFIKIPGFSQKTIGYSFYNDLPGKNEIEYEYFIGFGRNIVVHFHFDKDYPTKKEKDYVHNFFLDELLKWAKSIKPRKEKECLIRENWLLRRKGFIDYEAFPEWEEYLYQADSKVDLEKEWKEKWSKIQDKNSLSLYECLENGILRNGYHLLYTVEYKDGRIECYLFDELDSIFPFVRKLFEKQGEDIEFDSISVSYKDRYFMNAYEAAAGKELGDENGPIDRKINLYRLLIYNNHLLYCDFDDFVIDFKYDILFRDNSVKSISYRWWFCTEDMDFSIKRGKEFDLDETFNSNQVINQVNEFFDKNWKEDSLGITLYVKLDSSRKYVEIPICAYGKKHIDYYDLKQVLLNGIRLKNKKLKKNKNK